ncbi:MAG TPA: rhodanese-like domain-containing protein [Casimicrobiaceae bacterium]|nr:rhodanese-like domain-containing protein [Casimicrobiaceae bacterium]
MRKGYTMKPRFLIAPLAAALLLGTGAASALTESELQVVQKAAEEYAASLPAANNYDVTAEDVAARIKGGKDDFVIVDVRVPKDKKYDLGHVPGAMFIPVAEIAKPESLAKLPKAKDIIVYCDTGQQQSKAITMLRMMGYNAYGMRWGYMSWSTAPATQLTLDAIGGSITKGYPVAR